MIATYIISTYIIALMIAVLYCYIDVVCPVPRGKIKNSQIHSDIFAKEFFAPVSDNKLIISILVGLMGEHEFAKKFADIYMEETRNFYGLNISGERVWRGAMNYIPGTHGFIPVEKKKRKKNYLWIETTNIFSDGVITITLDRVPVYIATIKRLQDLLFGVKCPEQIRILFRNAP